MTFAHLSAVIRKEIWPDALPIEYLREIGYEAATGQVALGYAHQVLRELNYREGRSTVRPFGRFAPLPDARRVVAA